MKRSISLATGLLFLATVFISGAFAQEKTPKTIKAGVLNGKAIKLPAPAYPEAARADHAGGPVSVAVTIDETGSVIEAKAASEYTVTEDDGSGTEIKQIHPALREAAEKAALEAKFSTNHMMRGLRVSGTLIYNFVAEYSGPINEQSPITWQNVVLNHKALSLPAPIYPSAVSEAGATGLVVVEVTIDEAGNVISARAIKGHELLQAPAVDAALQAKFSPAVRDGQTVKISGALTYNFSGNPPPPTLRQNHQ